MVTIAVRAPGRDRLRPAVPLLLDHHDSDLVGPPGPRRLSARVPDHRGSLSAEVVKVSDELDLAILSVQGVAPPAVTLKEITGLGQDVWVVLIPVGPAAHRRARGGEPARGRR